MRQPEEGTSECLGAGATTCSYPGGSISPRFLRILSSVLQHSSITSNILRQNDVLRNRFERRKYITPLHNYQLSAIAYLCHKADAYLRSLAASNAKILSELAELRAQMKKQGPSAASEPRSSGSSPPEHHNHGHPRTRHARPHQHRGRRPPIKRRQNKSRHLPSPHDHPHRACRWTVPGDRLQNGIRRVDPLRAEDGRSWPAIAHTAVRG